MADFALLMSMAKITRLRDLEFDVGARVEIKGYGSLGTVRYYGPHLSKKQRVVYGVELDEPEGDNNGTVYEKKYFDCKPKYGLLAVPAHVKPPDPRRLASSTPKKSKKKKNTDDFGGFGDDEADGFGNDSGFAASPNESLGGFGDEGGGDSNDDDGFGGELDGFGEDEDDFYADTEYAQAESQEISVVAKFDFPGVEPEDLGFKKGERLSAKDIGDEDWWLARNAAGKEGMIPLDYVQIKSVAGV